MADWQAAMLKSLKLNKSLPDNFPNVVTPVCPDTPERHNNTGTEVLINAVKVVENETPKMLVLNHADLKIIIDGTKFYMCPRDLMGLRLVSNQFETLVGNYPNVRNGVSFHVNGKHPKYMLPRDPVPAPIQALLNSSFYWKHIKFSKMDLEGDFLGRKNLFEKFISQTCTLCLRSLTLVDCYIGMGRFIELISYCWHLEELKIVNCHSIFGAGLEIINWKMFMYPFRLRLLKVKHFTIMDNRRRESAVNADIMNVWMADMRQLVSLDVRSSAGVFPIGCIMKMVARNRRTLRHLSLVGECRFDSTLTSILSKLNLESLRLGNFELEFFNGLNQCLQDQKESLKSIHLYKMTIHADTLLAMAELVELKQLHLEDATIVGVREYAVKSLSSLTTLKDLRLQDSLTKRSCIPWGTFFECSSSYLTTLVLQFYDVHVLIKLIPKPCIRLLKKLVLMNVGSTNFFNNMTDLRTDLIRKIMWLKMLEKLEITDSAFVDSDFGIPIFNALVKIPSITDLTSLVMLNISRMNIGDDILVKVIIYLHSLQALYVDGTQVSYKGMETLGQQRKKGKHYEDPKKYLQNLRMISACRCVNLRVDRRCLDHLKDLFSPNVQLYCDMRNY